MIRKLLNSLNSVAIESLHIPEMQKNSIEIKIDEDNCCYQIFNYEGTMVGKILSLKDKSTFFPEGEKISLEELKKIFHFMENGPCPRCNGIVEKLEYSKKCKSDSCNYFEILSGT